MSYVEMVKLLKRNDKVLMVVTQSQAGRLKQHQPEQTREESSEGSSERGEVLEESVNAEFRMRVEELKVVYD